MDIRTKLKVFEDHFVILWMMVATFGYVILAASGQLDFRQYVVFLGILVVIYAVLKKQALFWFFLLFWVLYLVLIRANFIDSTTVKKIDTVFSKSVHDIVAIVKGEVK